MPLDATRGVAIALELVDKWAAGDARQNGGIVNLQAIATQDRQTFAIVRRIEECAGVPTGRKWPLSRHRS